MNKLFSIILVGLIYLYKIILSPFIGQSCRYQPTCSRYGMDAIKKHGMLKGSWFTLKRVCSCHPWGGHGYDPVP